MIVVDTSVLMAIARREPEAEACVAALVAEDHVLISAGTMAEALIVSSRRNLGPEVSRMIEELGFEIVTVTPVSARRVADAYDRWGRGASPAALNFGDCFAYALAKEQSCRLLYVGRDFSTTDIEGVL